MTTKPTIDLAELLDISEQRGGWVAQGEALRMRAWMREAVRLMDLARSDVSNGYYNDELAEELGALIAQVKRGEP